jgi:hypothetical protein
MKTRHSLAAQSRFRDSFYHRDKWGRSPLPALSIAVVASMVAVLGFGCIDQDQQPGLSTQSVPHRSRVQPEEGNQAATRTVPGMEFRRGQSSVADHAPPDAEELTNQELRDLQAWAVWAEAQAEAQAELELAWNQAEYQAAMEQAMQEAREQGMVAGPRAGYGGNGPRRSVLSTWDKTGVAVYPSR